MAIDIHSEVNRLVTLLTDEALVYGDGPPAYFRQLMWQVPLTREFRSEIANVGAGVPSAAARGLIEWALIKGGNPADPGSQTLGSILKVFIKGLGTEKWQYVV